MAKQSFYIVLVISILLSGCMSAAYTGANTVYNHYQITHSVSNSWLRFRVANQLHRNQNLSEQSDIVVTTYNSVVLLSGETENEKLREEAATIARNTPGVEAVINAIHLANVDDSDQDFKDSWITTKIKSKLIANKSIDAPKIHVVTENGVVYLIGVATPKQADIAISIAKHTSGVKQVVQVLQYEYITFGKKIA